MTAVLSGSPADCQAGHRLDDPAGRNFPMELAEHTGAMKFINRDRDTKFTASFDAAFAAARTRTSSPSGRRKRTPSASASSGLFGANIRPHTHPRRTAPGSRPRRGIEHPNSHRPHRSLSQPSPAASEAILPHHGDMDLTRPRRLDRMGGVIHDYTMVARVGQMGSRHLQGC
jgi:hypothetical protein